MARRGATRTTFGGQGDLFGMPLYPVRQPTADVEAINFRDRLKRSISQALKECLDSREQVAARMGELLGQPSMSAHMLNSYTSEGRETHQISVERFMALVRATKAYWLLDELACEVGCIVLQGEEAQLAERGLVLQQIDLLKKRASELKAPVSIARQRRTAR